MDGNNSSRNSLLLSKKRNLSEKFWNHLFRINALIAAAFIFIILFFLVNEAAHLFEYISPSELISGSSNSKEAESLWNPAAQAPSYSIVPLLFGTIITAGTATILSTFFGIVMGIYLSEVATPRTRDFLKPLIETFAGIPTVVLGFFMLVVVASFMQEIFNPSNRLNAFLAAQGLSFIVIPIIASITDDALQFVPRHIRMASYALGASKWQTIKQAILPHAINGLSAAIILAFSRAIGETMIVLMVSGNAAVISSNLFSSVRTATATIGAEMGEVVVNSSHYYALFFIGLILFVSTALFNLTSEIILGRIKRKLKRN